MSLVLLIVMAILDLVISNTDNIINNLTVHGLLSDHALVTFNVTRLYGLKDVNGKSCQRLCLSQI